MELDLDTANAAQGFSPIPAGTIVEVVMSIKAGSCGMDNLLKRSSRGDSEGLDVIYTVKGGDYDRRKFYGYHLLDGTTAGHAKAGEITRSYLRAIFEATAGIDPKDNSPQAVEKRANVSLAAFHGATFLAEIGIERGGEKPDGSRWPDKNVINKVLRVGDAGYRKLDQPPPAPVERSTPPLGATPTHAPNGSPAPAPTMISKPA